MYEVHRSQLALLRRPHPLMHVNIAIAAAQTRHCNGDVLALSNLPPGYDKEQTLSLASLEAQWPAKHASRNVRISMATLVYAHGTANLTNCGPSELVEEHIFHALQVRTRTIIL